MPGDAERRLGGGGAAVIIGNEIAAEPTETTSKKQARPAALDRACLSCGSPDVTGLCGSCEMERALERLCDSIAEQAQLLASKAGPSAPRLPVRPHLRPKPRLRMSRPELELALEWTRQAARSRRLVMATNQRRAGDVRRRVCDMGAGMSALRTMSAPLPTHIDFDEPDDERGEARYEALPDLRFSPVQPVVHLAALPAQGGEA